MELLSIPLFMLAGFLVGRWTKRQTVNVQKVTASKELLAAISNEGDFEYNIESSGVFRNAGIVPPYDGPADDGEGFLMTPECAKFLARKP